MGINDETEHVIDFALNTLRCIVTAFDQGWWTIEHDQWQAPNGEWVDCPDDDTCDCNGGVYGTAGMLSEAIDKLVDLQIKMNKNANL